MKNIVFFALTFALTFIALTASATGSRGLSINYKQSESANASYAGSMQLYTKSYALVIGIDNYHSGWPRLSNAISDAESIANALETKGFDVTLLTDLDGNDLDTAFEDFFIDKGDDPEARLFVWYAGHGHTVNGEGYLIPADGVLETDAKNFKRKSLSLRRFGEFVRLAESKHVYTVFDSCFAGTIFNVARSAPPPSITRITSEPARQFLSSGDAGQTVSDDGTFAKLFVEALAGKRRSDLNNDGYITANEMGSFLTNRISNYTNNKQIPRHGKLNDPDYDRGDFVFLASLTDTATAISAANAIATEKRSRPNSTGFNLDDLVKQAEENEASEKAWTQNLAEMELAFTQVESFSNRSTDTDMRKNAWLRFQQAFGEDNPYSRQDNALRARSQVMMDTIDLEVEQSNQQLALQGRTDQFQTGSRLTPMTFDIPRDLDLMIVYIPSRKNDARKAKKRLEKLGFEVKINETSDSGNGDFVDNAYYGGYYSLAKQLTETLSDIDDFNLQPGTNQWDDFEDYKIRFWLVD